MESCNLAISGEFCCAVNQPRYWTDAGSFEITRCSLDGSEIQVIQNKSAVSSALLKGATVKLEMFAKWEVTMKIGCRFPLLL